LTRARRAALAFVGAVREALRRVPRPTWTLLGIRVAFWVGATLTLLWAPLSADLVPPFRAYDALSDLLFGTFAQWDAQWFLHVADDGYDSLQSTAYFPLYPLLVHLLGAIVGSTLVAAVLLTLAAAAVSAAAIAAIARPLLGEQGARATVVLVALFPTAFVLTAPQSDALFLAASSGAFLAALRGRPWLAAACGALAVATRLVGLALVPALVLALWPRRPSFGEIARLIPLLLIPLPLVAYALYLDQRFGDPLAFAHAQQTYWIREIHPLGPIGGLWRGLEAGARGTLELLRHLPRAGDSASGFPERDQVALWNIVHAGMLIATLALTAVAWRRLGAALGLYSLASVLIAVTASPVYFPLASFPRYVLVDIPVFLALAALVDSRPRARHALYYAFVAVGTVAAVAYSRKIWIA